MNKKLQKSLVIGVAAAMGTGMVAPVVNAAPVDADALYKAAYDAVLVAQKIGTQEAVNVAREAINALKGTGAAFAIGEFSKQVDGVQQALFEEFMGILFNEKGEAVESLTVDQINAARALVDDFATCEANAPYISAWSSKVDEYVSAKIKVANAAVDKAKESKLPADKEAAEKLLKELKGIESEDVAKWVEAKEAELSKVQNDNFKVESIREVTVNTITVVLDKVPEKDLTAADFEVPGNTVKSVQKGEYDSVYILTLGTSLDGKKGNITVNGTSKAYDFTQLKLNAVKALNFRQLQLTFNKELNVYGAGENADGSYTVDQLLDQLHIWMVKEETGAVGTNSIASILGANAGDWHAYVQADLKTVVIESVDGSLINQPAGQGLDLKLNETYEVEAYNVLDNTEKFSSVSYVVDTLADAVRPSYTASAKVSTAVNQLAVSFSEPVKNLLNGGNYAGKAQVYVDGSLVPAAALTDVNNTTTVAAQKLLVIDTAALGFELSKGDHTVTIVGVEDLNNNLVSNNGKEITFTVVDPADAEEVTPVVKNIVQIADNAFKIVFNTTNVEQIDDGQHSVVIKRGAFNGDYIDIELGKDNIKAIEVDATSTTPAHTEWIVAVEGTAQTNAAKLSYKGANVINKTIELTNYQKDTGKAGKKYSSNLLFKKDTVAPVVKAVASDGNDTLLLKVVDDPFTTNDNGKVKAGVGKKATVKYVNEDGVTYSEEIALTGGTFLNSYTMVGLQVTNPDMLTNTGKLFAGGTYTIELPDGAFTDVKEDSPITGIKFGLDEEDHPFVARTLSYVIPGVVNEPLAPQTTRGLIISGYEVNNSVGGYATTVKGEDKIQLKDNQIVVVFEGDVDAKTAINKNNYTLNGKVLPAGTTIEYRQADIDADAGTVENFVVITLADNTIALTGAEDFTVANVANKNGYKMMPVADTVTLSDNTAPVAKSVQVRDSNKIVVTFSEEINIDSAPDMVQLATNFVIIANGKNISLADAHVEDRTKLVITLADNFDNNGDINVPVSVQIRKNSNGDVFVKDNAGNKAAEVTVKKN